MKKSIKYTIGVFMLFAGIAMVIIGSAIALPSVGWFKDKDTVSFTKEIDDPVNAVFIDFEFGQFEIKNGEKLKIETHDIVEDSFNYSVKNGVLSISYKDAYKNTFNFSKDNNSVILYLPDNVKYELLDIKKGTGVFKAYNFNVKKVNADLGAGESVLSGIKADDFNVHMGVGAISVDNSVILKGEIENKVGSCDINLVGDVNDYSFDIDGGIGHVKVNGKNPKDFDNFKGINKIKVNNGIGNINFNIK